jgi:hypothetical protein
MPGPSVGPKLFWTEKKKFGPDKKKTLEHFYER